MDFDRFHPFVQTVVTKLCEQQQLDDDHFAGAVSALASCPAEDGWRIATELLSLSRKTLADGHEKAATQLMALCFKAVETSSAADKHREVQVKAQVRKEQQQPKPRGGLKAARLGSVSVRQMKNPDQ